MNINVVDADASVGVMQLRRPSKPLYCDHNCGYKGFSSFFSTLWLWNPPRMVMTVFNARENNVTSSKRLIDRVISDIVSFVMPAMDFK